MTISLKRLKKPRLVQSEKGSKKLDLQQIV